MLANVIFASKKERKIKQFKLTKLAPLKGGKPALPVWPVYLPLGFSARQGEGFLGWAIPPVDTEKKNTTTAPPVTTPTENKPRPQE